MNAAKIAQTLFTPPTEDSVEPTPPLPEVEPESQPDPEDSEGALALLDLVGGRWPVERQTTHDRMRMALRAGGAAVVLAAFYGVVIGSTDLGLALGNAWKLPGVLALSSITALPAGLLAHRLMGGQRGSSSLFAATSAGNFAAALVLASLSPLVALYYHTSTMLGAPLAMGVGLLALFVGIGSGIRLMWREVGQRKNLLAPTGVLLGVQMLAMVQFLHLASPILPETTIFEAGIEGVLK